MKEQINFHPIINRDNEIHFKVGNIIIIIDHFNFNNGKHEITNPGSANAQFFCLGKKYSIDNVDEFTTVEDWYHNELLPKFQMFTLLMADTHI